MTTPTIFAAGYTDSEQAFLNAPGGQYEGARTVKAVATVPASTASGTVIGLVPFAKGATFMYDSVLALTDLDTGTNVTFTAGYVYDDNVTYTNDPDAFVTSNASAQTGGLVRFDATAGTAFVAEADGWLAVTTGGGSTTTAGTITYLGSVTYQV